MKGLVRLKGDNSVGDASGSRDRISPEAYLTLSVIWIMSLGGSLMETVILDTGLTRGAAVSLVGILFIYLGMLCTCV